MSVEPRPGGGVISTQPFVALAQSWEHRAAPDRDTPRLTTRRRVSDTLTDCALQLRHAAYDASAHTVLVPASLVVELLADLDDAVEAFDGEWGDGTPLSSDRGRALAGLAARLRDASRHLPDVGDGGSAET